MKTKHSKSLHEVMDKSKLFTIIFSGVENKDYYNWLYELGIRDFLMSYQYIQSNNIDMKARFKDKGVRLFIDSGAHTYQNDPKYLEKGEEFWEEQIKRYLAWVEENKEYIFAIASADYENLVGAETVKRWYREYFEPFMLRTKIPVCFVWHQNSYADWETYCERYPYVGLSSVNTEGVALDLNEYSSKLKVAEKYGSLVHGFGMTRTSYLPKLPYFTVDSTTWLVGLQYGEINYWRGTRMSRLKKEKWKGDYLPKIINQYSEFNIDRDGLLAEEPKELIKVNALAFISAEKYIRTKLKSKMYWLKPEAVENSREDINIRDKFPSVDWLVEAKTDNWEEYCKNLNIGTDDPERALSNLVDCTVFCFWDLDNEEFQDFKNSVYTEELINDLHDLNLNTMASSLDEKIEQLKEFYWNCVEGKDDTLLLSGSDFQRRPNEREHYIEEETEEVVDVPKESILNDLINANLLPMKEDNGIDELDEEIFKELDITPVRDSKGRFVKGQKKIRKPKNIYSKKFPKLMCDTCYAAQNCPEYKAGYVCAYHKMFKRFDSRNPQDIIDAMQSMVNLNMERMQRLAIFEMLDGGMPDGNLSIMIDQNMRLLSNMKAMIDNGATQVLKRETIVNSDGSSSETVTVNSPNHSVLEQLFMKNLNNNKEDKEKPKNVVDADYKVD